MQIQICMADHKHKQNRKPMDVNVLSNSCPVSLIDKTINFQSHSRGFDSAEAGEIFYCLFMRYEDLCVLVCYIQVYNIIWPVVGIHL